MTVREEEGAERPPGKRPIEGQADGEQSDRRGASGLRYRRNDLWEGDPEEAETQHADEQGALRDEQGPDAARPSKVGERSQGKNRAADRQRRAARERDDTVVAHEHTWRRDSVEREQCGHDRERRSDQHRAAVVPTRPDHCESDRCRGGGECCQADAREVEVAAERDLVACEEVAGRRGECRHRSAQDKDRSDPIAGTTPHASRMIGSIYAFRTSPKRGVTSRFGELVEAPDLVEAEPP